MANRPVLQTRGIQLHLSHYDPVWYERKAREKPFDLRTGLEAIDAMAEVGLNLLVIDCEDGVKYASHPELARPYSVPMSTLRALVERAGERGVEVVPKLNFSRSNWHHHNDWFRPHHRKWGMFDTPEYWRLAMEVVDELIANCRPRRFFHVGMDEDHDRTYDQYARAIVTLRRLLKARGLRPVVWNDTAYLFPETAIHHEKCLYAEPRIPKDVVEVVWQYETTKPRVPRRLKSEGFQDVWVAPGLDPEKVAKAVKVAKACGCTGILLTRWRPTYRKDRKAILNWIRTDGPICST
ncbi:MAG: hypothetical protein ACE15C_08750 [Phycisphaerae bacterium]